MKTWIAILTIFLLILYSSWLTFKNKTVIYNNNISAEHLLIGTKLHIPEIDKTDITFLYIFKFSKCPACQEEIQYLNHLYLKISDKIMFKGIIADCGDAKQQSRFIKGSGLRFNNIIVDSNFGRWQKVGFLHYPVKVITTPTGEILFADSLLYVPGTETGDIICSEFEKFLTRITDKYSN